MSQQLLLLKVSGPDAPGICADFFYVLSESKSLLLDMGQNVTYGLLSLSVIAKVSLDEKDLIISKLESVINSKGLRFRYEEIQDEFVKPQSTDRYIVSCVNQSGLNSAFLHSMTDTLAKNNMNIERVEKVSKRNFNAVDIFITATHKVDWEDIKQQLIVLSNEHTTDIALLKNDVWRKNKRLIVFDMDSTLIKNEVINEMAKAYGVEKEVSQITERAMNGEFDFDSSLIERVKLLKDMPIDSFQNVLKEIELTDGVEDVIKVVKELGYKVAVISGGFTYFANALKSKLGLDYVFANELIINDGKLTGEVKKPIVNASQKAMLLELLAQQQNIRLEQVVAVGDGANDLEMLAKAGLGIAFHAKDIVRKSAKQHMSHGPMNNLLNFLGIHESYKELKNGSL